MLETSFKNLEAHRMPEGWRALESNPSCKIENLES